MLFKRDEYTCRMCGKIAFAESHPTRVYIGTKYSVEVYNDPPAARDINTTPQTITDGAARSTHQTSNK